MTFDYLYNKAIISDDYKFDTERYVEEYPDFEQPARYLESIIESISAKTCVDDIIEISKKTIIPIMLQENKHVWFDTYLNTSSEINNHIVHSRNDKLLDDVDTSNRTRYNKSNHYFGSLIYTLLYQEYPSVRKYLHSITTEYVKGGSKITRNQIRSAIDNNNGIYCRVDDGSFSGAQYAEDITSTHNIFICSAMYDKALRHIGESEFATLKLNGIDVSNHKETHYYKNKRIKYKNKLSNNDSNDNEYSEEDSDNECSDDTYISDYDNTTNDNEEFNNDISYNDIIFDIKNSAYKKINDINNKHNTNTNNKNSNDRSTRNVYMYANRVIKQRCNEKERDNNNVYIEYKGEISSVLTNRDRYNWFYFQHKYPDPCSITETPLFMPTAVVDILDPEDIEGDKPHDYDGDYMYKHGTAMITGIKKKKNRFTKHYVNNQDMFDLPAFYK